MYQNTTLILLNHGSNVKKARVNCYHRSHKNALIVNSSPPLRRMGVFRIALVTQKSSLKGFLIFSVDVIVHFILHDGE